jgi:hypothetical protein
MQQPAPGADRPSGLFNSPGSRWGNVPETAISGTVTSLGGLKDSVGRRRDVTFPPRVSW